MLSLLEIINTAVSDHTSDNAYTAHGILYINPNYMYMHHTCTQSYQFKSPASLNIKWRYCILFPLINNVITEKEINSILWQVINRSPQAIIFFDLQCINCMPSLNKVKVFSWLSTKFSAGGALTPCLKWGSALCSDENWTMATKILIHTSYIKSMNTVVSRVSAHSRVSAQLPILQGWMKALPYKSMHFLSRVSAHMCKYCELWKSTHGHLSRRLRYYIPLCVSTCMYESNCYVIGCF